MIDEAAISDEGFALAEFTITFSYTANGQNYFSKYKAGSPEELGHTFEIQYDPSNPKRNTGSEGAGNPWWKAVSWVLGGALGLFLVWLSQLISD